MAIGNDLLFAGERGRRQATALMSALPSNGVVFTAEVDDGSAVPVPVELSEIIARVVHAVARGHAVTVDARSAEFELTTTEAAHLLGVSRPALMREINAGEIPSHEVGPHTRLRAADVLKEQHDRGKRQSAAFEELRAREEDWSGPPRSPR
ncbi:helix-turn-helix domain-containing protein [Umezawaea sp.]|uniref:helix-turn-helix domain-containing protein n=1 Tax=Umezawaea sp. TaxID=1955258 RepID=UPI002ED5DF3D